MLGGRIITILVGVVNLCAGLVLGRPELVAIGTGMLGWATTHPADKKRITNGVKHHDDEKEGP